MGTEQESAVGDPGKVVMAVVQQLMELSNLWVKCHTEVICHPADEIANAHMECTNYLRGTLGAFRGWGNMVVAPMEVVEQFSPEERAQYDTMILSIHTALEDMDAFAEQYNSLIDGLGALATCALEYDAQVTKMVEVLAGNASLGEV